MSADTARNSPGPVDVVVLGGAALDVILKAHPPVRASQMSGQSTPSRLLKRCMGGVGRNIAEVLARLGARVAMLTIVGDDTEGRELLSGMQEVGIDIGGTVIAAPRSGPQARGATGGPSSSTATYTALLGSDGELAVAAANMGIFDELEGATVLASSHARRVLSEAAFLVIDANVSAECAGAVVAHTRRVRGASCRVVFEAVSRAKCVRCLPFVAEVDLLKPNLAEAIELAAHIRKAQTQQHLPPPPPRPTAVESAIAACRTIVLDGGARGVLCTLGRDGALVAWHQRSHRSGGRPQLAHVHLPAVPIAPGEVRKVTGAGDTALACAVFALLLQQRERERQRGTLQPDAKAEACGGHRTDSMNLVRAARVGLEGARLALMSSATINPEIPVRIAALAAAAKAKL